MSRLSLPFLVGTFFTSNRNRATVIGYLVCTIGGWGFAMLYFLFFAVIGMATLLAAALPLLPYAHPCMASEHDGPRTGYILEPPGFFGLNYGRRTPITTMLGQIVYGAPLGGLCQLAGVV